MSERPARRWAQALATLALVERRSPALGTALRWRPVTTSGSTAYLRAPGRVDRSAPDAPVPRRLAAPVRADTVAIGKFDQGRQVRLRGFYLADERCVRVQAGSRDPAARHAVSRSVLAARVVGQHHPGLVPPLLDHGGLFRGRTAFLVEAMITGRTPGSQEEVAAAMTATARELRVVHQGVGIVPERLSEVTHPQFRDRWQAVVDDGRVPAPVAERVADLIARDELLEVSFAHGDLVSSNVLQRDSGVVLIDWEYAGSQPIAFDLAKMHVNAGAPGPATEALDAALDRSVGHRRGHYSLLEQLALAHVVVLSRLEARLLRAQAAGRTAALERQTRRRAQVLGTLLGLGR